jgi:sorting nexin-8
VDENPLSSSVYDDGLDPWSAAPSPTPTPVPQLPSSVFNAVIGELVQWRHTLDSVIVLKSRP